MSRIVFGSDEANQLLKPGSKRKLAPGLASKKPADPLELVKMSERDCEAVAALNACVFLPGSYNKRFAGSMASAAASTKVITKKQRLNLWRLVYRYRRQIEDQSFIGEAREIIAAA
jgi:hypothetical protein